MDEKYTARYTMVTSGCSHSSSTSSKEKGKRKTVALKLCECDGVELLSKRLQVLEEEASMMREEMVVCMDERREIITEILQLFRTIHTTHQQSAGSDSKQVLPLSQGGRYPNVGLLQALCEDSKDGLVAVTRGHTVANEIVQARPSRFTCILVAI